MKLTPYSKYREKERERMTASQINGLQRHILALQFTLSNLYANSARMSQNMDVLADEVQRHKFYIANLTGGRSLRK